MNSRLFITLKQLTNDVTNYCNNKIDYKQNNSTKCSAFPTQSLASECNGKQECEVKLDKTTFEYGFMGSNCDFQAEILFISYECIPIEFNEKYMPKYDICSGSSNNVIDHPIHGFIHTPSYPNVYQSKLFCQLTIRFDETIERIEIFLIDMQLEGLSTTYFKPTDYLQINSNEILFGEKNYLVIYNETNTAVIKFTTDRWFNKRGFLLYFQAIKLVVPTVKITDTTTIETTTTTPISATPLLINATLNKTSTFSSMPRNAKDTNGTNSTQVDLTSRMMFILILIIGLLSLLIVFLIFSRKSMCQTSRPIDVSKIELTNRINDTVNLDYYLAKSAEKLSCNNIGFVNNQQQQFYKLNHLNRNTDDSAVKLLINGSLNYTEPINTTNLTTTEVYEDITLEYIKKEPTNEHLKKVNEYCYIPSNLIKGEASNDLQTTSANDYQPESIPCTTSDLSTSVSSVSPSLNSPSKVTSTPTAPKSQPPHLIFDVNESISIAINDKYDVPTQVYTPNEYKVFLELETKIISNENVESMTFTNENNDEANNYEYQIPSNLPMNSSIVN